MLMMILKKGSRHLLDSSQGLDPSLISSMIDQAQQSLQPSPATLLPSVESRPGMSRHEYRREVHLLTLTSFPSTVQMCLGGVVCARAVKLLDSSRSGGSQHAHDQWWLSLRKEVKNHARALNCTTVIGYTETTTIHDDVIVLTSTGTQQELDGLDHSECNNTTTTYTTT